jgi:hypothetical protein
MTRSPQMCLIEHGKSPSPIAKSETRTTGIRKHHCKLEALGGLTSAEKVSDVGVGRLNVARYSIAEGFQPGGYWGLSFISVESTTMAVPCYKVKGRCEITGKVVLKVVLEVVVERFRTHRTSRARACRRFGRQGVTTVIRSLRPQGRGRRRRGQCDAAHWLLSSGSTMRARPRLCPRLTCLNSLVLHCKPFPTLRH